MYSKLYQTENVFLTLRNTISSTDGDLAAAAASSIRPIASLSPSSMNITMAEIRGTLANPERCLAASAASSSPPSVSTISPNVLGSRVCLNTTG